MNTAIYAALAHNRAMSGQAEGSTSERTLMAQRRFEAAVSTYSTVEELDFARRNVLAAMWLRPGPDAAAFQMMLSALRQRRAALESKTEHRGGSVASDAETVHESSLLVSSQQPSAAVSTR
jgi:hypothetical protein